MQHDFPPGCLWIDDNGLSHPTPVGQGLGFVRYGKGWVVARYNAPANRLTGLDRHPRTGPLSLKGALYCGKGHTHPEAQALAGRHPLPG